MRRLTLSLVALAATSSPVRAAEPKGSAAP
jgi:hypothetical protein